MADTKYDEEGFVQQEFDQIRVYDAPMVAISQMFEGEASWRSIKDTFLNPEKLSPSERDSFVGRIKESVGGNPLTNAVIDVALNPFVWFLFMTTPAAGPAMKATGKVFTGLAKKAVDSEGADYFKYVIGKYSPLQTLGLLNAHQYGAGTPLPAVLYSLTSRLSQLTRKDLLQTRGPMAEAIEGVKKKFGVKSLDSLHPDAAPPDVWAKVDGEMISLKDYLKKFTVYADMYSRGMHKTVNRKVGTIAPRRWLKYRATGDKDFMTAEVHPKTASRIEDITAEIDPLTAQIARDKAAGQPSTTRIRNLTSHKKKRLALINRVLKLEGKPPIGLEHNFEGITTGYKSKGLSKPLDEGLPLKTSYLSKQVHPLDPKGLSAKWLEQEGFLPLLSTGRQQMKGRYVDMFGDVKKWEESGGKVLEHDKEKLTRIWMSLSRGVERADKVEISNILSRELVGHVEPKTLKILVDSFTAGSSAGKPFKPKIEFSEFQKLLVGLRQVDDLDNYMPRNVWTTIENRGGQPFKSRSDSSHIGVKGRDPEISGRVNERRLEDPTFDSDDLQVLAREYEKKGIPNKSLDGQMEKSINYESLSGQAKGGKLQVMNLDWLTSFRKYLKSTRNDVALHIDPIDDQIKLAVDRHSDLGKTLYESAKPGTEVAKYAEFRGHANRYEAMKYVADAMRNVDGAMARSGGTRAANYVMDTLLERIRGNNPMRDLVSEIATLRGKEVSGKIANSNFMKQVEKMGGPGEKFIRNLRNFSETELTSENASGLGRGVTKLFYASHLGVNPASAALNLMQPLMFTASWAGMPAMVKAYGQAFKQYFGYIQARLKLGLRADPITVDDLRAKHFRLSNVATKDRPDGIDLLDIRKTDYELMDAQAFAGASQRSGGWDFWATEMPLKLFTHTEIFNRVVTGEAILAKSMQAGKLGGLGKMKPSGAYATISKSAKEEIDFTENVMGMVQNTQFGSDLINSPKAFQDSFFGIPWVRQFFTFPVRTLTAWTDTAPMINQGRRTWGLTGFETQGRHSAMMHDLMRMMGTSAVLYEAGKNVAGIDLSRGLTAQTMYDSTIVGPALLEDRRDLAYNLPLSPALDIVLDSANAITSDDRSLLGSLLPRFVPGGIAGFRALNMAPPLTKKDGWLGGLQRESADWGAMNEQGQIPIYREDGGLKEYRSAARTVLGGLGFNSYIFNEDKALNKFLIANRQGIVDERRKYLDAALNNNMGKAAVIKKNFEKRFKFPLSVSKSQLEGAIQLREVPLKERMYQRITPQFRPKVRPYLAERLDTLKSRTAEELDLSTAQKARTLPSSFDGNPDVYDLITD